MMWKCVIQMYDTCMEKKECSGLRKSIGMIINQIDNLELKMRKMTTSEDRGRDPLFKPQVAPPRCRGGGS